MLIRSSAAIAAARFIFTAVAIVALSASAEAANITFVAANGNDANPCTVITAPCKTLQRAYTVTPANGTINVLTSLESTLAINKNITVAGNGAAIVGSIAIGTSSTNAVVTLRGLALNGAKIYTTGIRINAAAAVHIEDCTVERYTTDGISLVGASATELFISDTVSRDNNNGLSIFNASAHVAVEDSRFDRNAQEGIRLNADEISITRSTASKNGFGIFISGGGTANITETVVVDSASHGFQMFTSGGATIATSVARGNGTGLFVNSGVSVVITDSVFTYNTTGINNGGILYTRENNTNIGNTTNYSGAGIVTPFGGV